MQLTSIHSVKWIQYTGIRINVVDYMQTIKLFLIVFQRQVRRLRMEETFRLSLHNIDALCASEVLRVEHFRAAEYRISSPNNTSKTKSKWKRCQKWKNAINLMTYTHMCVLWFDQQFRFGDFECHCQSSPLVYSSDACSVFTVRPNVRQTSSSTAHVYRITVIRLTETPNIPRNNLLQAGTPPTLYYELGIRAHNIQIFRWFVFNPRNR